MKLPPRNRVKFMALENRSEEGRRDGAACKDEITCRNKTGQVRKRETRAAGHDDSSAKYTLDEPLVRGDNLCNLQRVQYMAQSFGRQAQAPFGSRWRPTCDFPMSRQGRFVWEGGAAICLGGDFGEKGGARFTGKWIEGCRVRYVSRTCTRHQALPGVELQGVGLAAEASWCWSCSERNTTKRAEGTARQLGHLPSTCSVFYQNRTISSIYPLSSGSTRKRRIHCGRLAKV